MWDYDAHRQGLGFFLAAGLTCCVALPGYGAAPIPGIVPIAATGQAVAGVPGRIIGDLPTSPMISESGQITFRADATYVGTPGSFSLFSAPGTPIPGFPTGSTWGTTIVQGFDGYGRVLATGGLYQDGAFVDNYLWFGTADSLSGTLLSNAPAPGLPAGVTYQASFQRLWAFNSNDQAVMLNSLQGSGVNSSNNQGLFVGKPDSLTLLARTGDHAPSLPDGYNFTSLNPTAQVNSQGQVAFVGMVSGPGVVGGQQNGAWIGTPDSLQLLTFAPSSAPAGYDYFQISNPSLNSAGQVAFMTRWIKSFGGDGSSSGSAIYAGIPGALKQIAVDDASLGAPLITSAGDVLFPQGGGLSLSNQKGVRQVIPGGSQAPGLPAGTTFTAVIPIASNRTGEYLVQGVFGSKSGLWGNYGGKLYLIAYDGESVDLGNGQTGTLAAINCSSGFNGENGVSPVLNDRGQVVFNAITGHVGGGTQYANFFAQLPIPGDANLDGLVDRGDLAILSAHLGEAGDLAFGDFNGDGMVTFKDFQILELNFGLAIDPISPAASLGIAQEVPEPSAMMLLSGIMPLLFRHRRSKRWS